jgi:hypothetical protein
MIGRTAMVAVTPDQRRAMMGASNSDRDWFAQHPDRSHRLRLAHPGEVAALDAAADKTATWWVVTRQIEPGVRLRTAFRPPLPPPDDETIGQVLFDLIVEHGAAGQRYIPMIKVFERWNRTAPASRA